MVERNDDSEQQILSPHIITWLTIPPAIAAAASFLAPFILSPLLAIGWSFWSGFGFLGFTAYVILLRSSRIKKSVSSASMLIIGYVMVAAITSMPIVIAWKKDYDFLVDIALWIAWILAIIIVAIIAYMLQLRIPKKDLNLIEKVEFK